MSLITRSGRTVKKPERYEPPVEKLLDDYDDYEYEEDDIDDDDVESIHSQNEESDDDEEDADENGNLKGFVESDSEEDDD